MDIGNTLGSYVRSAEQTRANKYTSYARICVYMHIVKSLPDSINLSHEDFEWIQSLDYEHVPFRCRKCHEHGHLFRDCPLNKPKMTATQDIDKDEEGFQRAGKKRRQHKKGAARENKQEDTPTSNRFTILEEQPENPEEEGLKGQA